MTTKKFQFGVGFGDIINEEAAVEQMRARNGLLTARRNQIHHSPPPASFFYFLSRNLSIIERPSIPGVERAENSSSLIGTFCDFLRIACKPKFSH